MPADRTPGMDNPYYSWSPIVARPPLRWPAEARVALCVVVSLEHLEMDPPKGSFSTGGSRPGPFPDVTNFSRREYGNRVGAFRMMDVMAHHGLTATAAMDVMTARRYPELVRRCRDRGWEIAGHGESVTRVISSRMSEDTERAYVRASLDGLQELTGRRPDGWLGPEYGESTRTPAILAGEGVRYLMDWPNDEQPYLMNTEAGPLVSIPVMIELDDAFAHAQRHIPIWRWGRMVAEAFDTLYEEGAESGRLLVLNLHPWLVGQPYRIGVLDEALRYICGHPYVWKATGAQIADWYLEHAAKPSPAGGS